MWGVLSIDTEACLNLYYTIKIKAGLVLAAPGSKVRGSQG